MREARQQVAQAFWLREPGCGEIRPVGLPEPGPGDVVVRTVRSGISRGTETLVFRGAVPADQRTRMRAPFQEGDFPGPVKYGYLHVGAVAGGATFRKPNLTATGRPHASTPVNVKHRLPASYCKKNTRIRASPSLPPPRV